jgi:hypothetical protein
MTNVQEWAAKVERAANDPERIERRKGIAPTLTVPRSRHEDACIWELAETLCPECAARIQDCADQDDSGLV